MAAALHIKLLTDISDMMEIDGPEYITFVFHMTQFVAKGLLNSKRNLLDKFAAMKSKGKLDIGKYDNLKKVAQDSGNDDVLGLIQEREPEILEALASEKGGKICSPSSSATDNEIIGPAKRPAKRPWTEVDSSDPLSYRDHEEHGYYDNTGKRGLLLILDSKEDRKDASGPAKQPRTGRQLCPLYYGDQEENHYYDNTGKRGFLLILDSKEDRKGTEKDVEKLKGFFGDRLRFEVLDPRANEGDDLTTEQIDIHLNDVRTWLNGSLGSTHYYCFICVILSHGYKEGVKTRNGLKSIDEIRRFFNNRNMPHFAGRPKVFFIQACRVYAQCRSYENYDADDDIIQAARNNDTVDDADAIIRIPTDADTLLAYATTPGYRSFRRLGVGSWFITECMNVFKNNHKKDHLEDMLITVRRRVASDWTKHDGTKQMPCVWSTLTKKLMLTENDTL